LPHDFKYNAAWKRAIKQQGDIHKQRLDLLAPILANPPDYKPGSEHHYSNAGLVLAGLMAEQITGLTWEDLVFNEVIKPLGITSAGFGSRGTKSNVDQPLGHRMDRNKVIPINPGTKADNPPVMGPSGTLHMNLPDYALFIREQMLGEGGNGKLLNTQTYKLMHNDADGKGFGLGWGVDNEPIFGRVLNHTGSNGYWFHRVWIAPEKGIGIAIASNIMTNDSQKAFEELLYQLKQLTSIKSYCVVK
jgi:CubicO group peptidase (beta-lactamase class C family)